MGVTKLCYRKIAVLQLSAMKSNANAPVKKACKVVGGQCALAIALGLDPSQVHQWVKGRRSVPIKYCQSIVELTDGAVSVQDLRPKDWHLIWPAPKSTEVDLIHEKPYDPNEGNHS